MDTQFLLRLVSYAIHITPTMAFRLFEYAGAMMFMLNYLALSSNKMKQGSWAFHITILFGTVTVLLGAWTHSDYPVVLLEIFGFCSTIYFIIGLIRKRSILGKPG